MALPEIVKVLPQTELHGQDDLDDFYARQLDLGYEGAILRNSSALYKEGRATAKSQDMLKFKPFLDSDAIVLDVYEAMTNNNPTFTNELGRTDRSTHAENLEGNGMAGGFTVRMGTKVFNIAAGKLNHDQRREVLQNKDKYIGQLATFRHLPIGEKDVPRHGRFMRWRSKLDT
jgi:DNA ligase-1